MIERTSLAIVAVLVITVAPLAAFGASPGASVASATDLAPPTIAGEILNIIHPRMMRPAFASPGGTLEVVVSYSGDAIQAPSVGFNPGGYEGAVEAMAFDGSNATLTVRLPDMPEADYSISVGLNDTILEQERAVAVRDAFGDDYLFLHLTDLHIGAEGCAEKFPVLREEVALLNPDFVVISGDLIDANMGGDSEAETLEMLELLGDFPCPTFAIPGNHEYGYAFSSGSGLDDYLNYVNPVLDYSFTYGDDTFVMMNTGKYSTILSLLGYEIPNPNNNVTGLTDGQIDWLIETFEGAPDGNRFLVTHAPLVNSDEFNQQTPDNNRLAVIEIAETYGIDVVLSGHTHEDRLFGSDGVRRFGAWPALARTGAIPPPERPWHVQTRSALVEGDSGFRPVRVSGNDIELTADYDGDGFADANSSIMSSKLTVENLSESSVKIMNGAGWHIHDGRVVINTTEAFDEPETSGGCVLELASGDGWTRAVVSVDIAPGENMLVSLVENPAPPKVAAVALDASGDSITVRFDKAVYLADGASPFALSDSSNAVIALEAVRVNWSAFRLTIAGNPSPGEAKVIYSGAGIADYRGRSLETSLEVSVILFPDRSAWDAVASFDAPFNPLTDSIEITFARPVDKGSAERGLSFTHSVPHEIAWTDGTRLEVRFTEAVRIGSLAMSLVGAVSADGAPMNALHASITIEGDLLPPTLLGWRIVDGANLSLEFSEHVSGVHLAISPVSGVVPVSDCDYLASPPEGTTSLLLDPSKVCDASGNSLDSDGDGLPGGPDIKISLIRQAPTGAVEGTCPEGNVTLEKGMVFRRVPSPGGEYFAGGLEPGVWTVRCGDACMSVVVEAGVTAFANLSAVAQQTPTGSVTVRCPGGVVSIGGISKTIDGQGSVTFSDLAPGTYGVVYDNGEGVQMKTVAVAPGEDADCEFEESEGQGQISLAYLVGGTVVIALLVLAAAFVLLRGRADR